MTPEQLEFNRGWIRILRSGKYPQGRGVLRTRTDNFCCLGVASEIAGVECRKSALAVVYAYDASNVKESMPSEKWFTETTSLPYEFATDLARANDHGYSFNYIADGIEKQLS
jgi:hypothetical protein